MHFHGPQDPATTSTDRKQKSLKNRRQPGSVVFHMMELVLFTRLT